MQRAVPRASELMKLCFQWVCVLLLADFQPIFAESAPRAQHHTLLLVPQASFSVLSTPSPITPCLWASALVSVLVSAADLQELLQTFFHSKLGSRRSCQVCPHSPFLQGSELRLLLAPATNRANCQNSVILRNFPLCQTGSILNLPEGAQGCTRFCRR